MLKISEIFEFSKETFRKIPILKEFEWFEMVRMVRSLTDRTFQLCRPLARRRGDRNDADAARGRARRRAEPHGLARRRRAAFPRRDRFRQPPERLPHRIRKRRG